VKLELTFNPVKRTQKKTCLKAGFFFNLINKLLLFRNWATILYFLIQMICSVAITYEKKDQKKSTFVTEKKVLMFY